MPSVLLPKRQDLSCLSVQAIGMSFCPESPVWLEWKGHTEAAWAAKGQLQGQAPPALPQVANLSATDFGDVQQQETTAFDEGDRGVTAPLKGLDSEGLLSDAGSSHLVSPCWHVFTSVHLVPCCFTVATSAAPVVHSCSYWNMSTLYCMWLVEQYLFAAYYVCSVSTCVSALLQRWFLDLQLHHCILSGLSSWAGILMSATSVMQTAGVTAALVHLTMICQCAHYIQTCCS